MRRAEAQIDALAEKLRHAERKQPHLEASAREECGETLKHLWQKEHLARVKIEEIRKAPADQWQALRHEEDSLLIHLQKSYQHLVNRYFK